MKKGGAERVASAGSRNPKWKVSVLLAALLVGLFLVSGPWQVGSSRVRHVSQILVAAVVLLTVGASLSFGWHRVRRAVVAAEIAIRQRDVLIGALILTAILVRVVVSKFHALEINAWDFSIFFDRPLHRTLEGRPLYCEYFDRSFLGTHASFLMFALVPLHALIPSPYLLLVVQALAIVGATVVAFLVFRSLVDDGSAALLALAFCFNPHTARALIYAFHVEIFYPLAIFTLLLGIVKRRTWIFACGLAMLLLIKEDFILVAAGLALVTLPALRRVRLGIVMFLIAVAVFVIDYRFVLPHFSGSSEPWFSNFWGSWGETPLNAAVAIVSQPWRTVTTLAGSGLLRLFVTVMLVPVVGVEVFAAALPALVVYGVSDHRQLSQFVLYYSMPVLPLLYASMPFATRRIAGWMKTTRFSEREITRTIAVAALATSLLMGPGLSISSSRPELRAIQPALSRLQGDEVVFVQGALHPHVGYERRLEVLDERSKVDGAHGFLLCVECDPYPLGRDQVGELADEIRRSEAYTIAWQRDGLLLALPTEVTK